MAKSKVICDTDVMIDYWDTKCKRYEQTKLMIDDVIGLDNLVISAITKMELLMGARDKEEETSIRKKLHRLNVVLINNEITHEAINLFETYRLSHGLSIPDCFIAATSIITELKLFSYYVKDYQYINNLELFVKE